MKDEISTGILNIALKIDDLCRIQLVILSQPPISIFYNKYYFAVKVVIMEKFNTVEDYFNASLPEAKERLLEMRNFLKSILPNAEEVISYNMPAFKQNGIVVWYAGYKNHTGFYPSGSGIAHFENQLQSYKYSKGAIQFMHNQPLPTELIKTIALFRLNENEIKAMNKKKK